MKLGRSREKNSTKLEAIVVFADQHISPSISMFCKKDQDYVTNVEHQQKFI